MELPKNKFKQALHEGRRQTGIWCSMSHHVTAEILAGAGFDWVLIDTEHSPNELPMVHNQLQAMAGGTATPIVRPAWNDMVLVKRYLDVGVQTLLLPYVQNEQEARNAVAYTRYPPDGVRGFASASRASGYGRVKDYHRRASDELCVLVQTETRTALSQLEAIAAVEGIDGIFIGPGDLSADMGHLGDTRHPDVWKAIEDAAKRIREAGKAPGILV
ncbi:MAG: HpcH/HpaI aldolase family protein, partial [Terriglobia bacterium]